MARVSDVVAALTALKDTLVSLNAELVTVRAELVAMRSEITGVNSKLGGGLPAQLDNGRLKVKQGNS